MQENGSFTFSRRNWSNRIKTRKPPKSCAVTTTMTSLVAYLTRPRNMDGVMAKSLRN